MEPDNTGGALPPPADKASAARSANFAKARDALKAKREAEKADKPESDKPEKVSDSSLRDGARIFVRVTWGLSKLACRLAGRSVEALTEAEISEGAEEALPLLRRISPLAFILGLLGYPAFILRKLDEKMKPKEPPTKKAAEPDNKGATVHNISASTGGAP